MEVLEIKNSSAIATISFDTENSIVGVAFTSNTDKVYEYKCETIDEVKTKLIETETEGGSVGKLIHSFRKDGILEIIPEVEVK